jgi:hypothetical protein
LRPLSTNAVSAMIGGAIVAVLSAGTAVAVTTTNVSVTDASSGVRAHVTGNQALVVAPRDPYNGGYTRVSSGGLVVNARDAVPASTSTLQVRGLPSDGVYDYDVTATTPKVPSSGRFEIQTVSVAVTVPPGNKPTVQIRYTANGASSTYYLPIIYQATRYNDAAAVSDEYFGAMDVHLYADPGTAITAYVDRHQAGSISSYDFEVRFAVSGHTG